MKERCYYKHSISYENYGKRGITVCDEWRDDFAAFRNWAILHGYKDDKRYQLDRIDNNKGYSPDNCRFITRVAQMNNTRANHHVTYNGVTKTVAEWARLLEADDKALSKRLRRCNDDLELACSVDIPGKDWGPIEGRECGTRKAKIRHDKPKSSLYNIWWSTMAQCCHPTYNRYARYGAKGITICDAWKGSFQEFKKWALESGYEDDLGLMLKRRDEAGPFSPENCCWESRRQWDLPQ